MPLPFFPHYVLFVFANIGDGILIDTRWVYHFESRGGQLLDKIASSAVGRIVVSRHLKIKTKYTELIRKFLSLRAVAARSRAGVEIKIAHLFMRLEARQG